MFQPLDTDGVEVITFTFDNQTIIASAGMTVAAALLASEYKSLRETPVSGAKRGPYCMMGACYDCLVSIEGKTVQACMTPVRQGQLIKRIHKPKDITENLQ